MWRRALPRSSANDYIPTAYTHPLSTNPSSASKLCFAAKTHCIGRAQKVASQSGGFSQTAYYADIRPQSQHRIPDSVPCGDHARYADTCIEVAEHAEMGFLNLACDGRGAQRTSTFCVVLRTSPKMSSTTDRERTGSPLESVLDENTLLTTNSSSVRVSKHAFTLSALPRLPDADDVETEKILYVINKFRVYGGEDGNLFTSLRPSRVLNWVREEVVAFNKRQTETHEIETATVVFYPCLGCLLGMCADWSRESGMTNEWIAKNALNLQTGINGGWREKDVEIAQRHVNHLTSADVPDLPTLVKRVASECSVVDKDMHMCIGDLIMLAHPQNTFTNSSSSKSKRRTPLHMLIISGEGGEAPSSLATRIGESLVNNTLLRAVHTVDYLNNLTIKLDHVNIVVAGTKDQARDIARIVKPTQPGSKVPPVIVVIADKAIHTSMYGDFPFLEHTHFNVIHTDPVALHPVPPPFPSTPSRRKRLFQKHTPGSLTHSEQNVRRFFLDAHV